MAALDRELLLQAEGVQAHCPARRQNRSELRRHDLHRRRPHQLTMNPNRPYGGIAAVARATGIARSTIGRGLADLDQPALPPGQVRRAGSGRKPVQEKDPTLLADLRRLVEPATTGHTGPYHGGSAD